MVGGKRDSGEEQRLLSLEKSFNAEVKGLYALILINLKTDRFTD